MNAFFASVEQQVDTRLRGRPVAITALETGTHNNWAGAVVAASYEAKAQGVKTIMRLAEASQIALGGRTGAIPAALGLARDIKKIISEDAGSQLRCSIGIGPNHLLAKIAGKLEKPDGLQWLAPTNMPGAIVHLKLDDFPGISRGMSARLGKVHV